MLVLVVALTVVSQRERQSTIEAVNLDYPELP